MEGELVLIRTRLNDKKSGVFGSLLLNGHFICHTLENKLIDSSNAETMVTMICRNCKHLIITEKGE